MPTLGANDLTIADAAKYMGADGKILAVAKLLHQRNNFVSDLSFIEGDTEAGHMSAQESSLPTVSTKIIGAGTAGSKATAVQALESPETIEGWSVIDDGVARFGGNVGGKRAQQAMSFVESMRQTANDRYFYGNSTTTPGQLRGLAQRYATLGGTTGQNIIDAGGTGSDNSSIWVVGHGEGKIYGFYPKGSQAGLRVTDWGKTVRTNSDSTEQVVHREQFEWAFGLAVDDWRWAVRIANVDISALVAGSGADLYDRLISAYHLIPDISEARMAIYMNRTVRQMFDIQGRNDVVSGGGLTFSNVDGVLRETWRGIPVNINDRLTEAEARIV